MRFLAPVLILTVLTARIQGGRVNDVCQGRKKRQ
jgi:hypothetical protein